LGEVLKARREKCLIYDRDRHLHAYLKLFKEVFSFVNERDKEGSCGK